MNDSNLMLYLGPPIGWIALSPTELIDLQKRAHALVPDHLKTGINSSQAEQGAAEAQLHNANEAARLLAVPASWLGQQHRKRTIPSHQLGKYARFNVAEIIAHCRIAPDDTRFGKPTIHRKPLK